MHNYSYEIAWKMFELARKTELAETGRDFPMALWGLAMSTMMILWGASDCSKAQGELKKLPDPLPAWLTPFEVDLINTGFELYPSDFDNCEVDDTQYKREERLANALAKVANKYPEQVDVQALYLTAKLSTLENPSIKQNAVR